MDQNNTSKYKKVDTGIKGLILITRKVNVYLFTSLLNIDIAIFHQ